MLACSATSHQYAKALPAEVAGRRRQPATAASREALASLMAAQLHGLCREQPESRCDSNNSSSPLLAKITATNHTSRTFVACLWSQNAVKSSQKSILELVNNVDWL
jgi:hypothetical protein